MVKPFLLCKTFASRQYWALPFFSLARRVMTRVSCSNSEVLSLLHDRQQREVVTARDLKQAAFALVAFALCVSYGDS